MLLTPQTVKSQTKKGNLLIEGNLGNISLSSNRNDREGGFGGNKSKNWGYNISLFPRIGLFVTDDLVVGSTVAMSHQSNWSASYRNDGTKSNDGVFSAARIGYSPFMRYYFTKNAKSRFYGQLGIGRSIDIYRTNQSTSYDAAGNVTSTFNSSWKSQFISGEALIGLNHFITENLAFNSSIGFGYNKQTLTIKSSSTRGEVTNSNPENKEITLSGNLSWNVGFVLIITRKTVK
ncbi:MAG: hypothetical protein EAY81_08350 [Bacteroidetes bacterium]|nr:MAG: hypothetical protein EAY81_08350 [Bacteroidota bacterium]